jgi:two-component system chemotaxis response regulator CheY
MAVNILVVDDSLPMRSVIIKTIKVSGYGSANFLQASNGREAIKTLENQWVDLVITDYNMPGMDGMELISEMKQDETLRSIPVLVVTTEGSQMRVEEFIKKGAAGYIQKPFTPEVIRMKLNKILGEIKDEEPVESSNEDLDF